MGGRSQILTERRGVVSVLTINRPERRNALGIELLAEISRAMGEARLDPGIRAIVLTGAPPVFCAGMDMKELSGVAMGEVERGAIVAAQSFADLIAQIHECPKPVIAAINGDALAGGAGLAMACDLAIAAEGASLGYPEVKRGLVAAIVMHDLARLVGDRRARQLLLTGEPISAVEAEQWGLVNRVVRAGACVTEAVEQAESFASVGPVALATTKALLGEAIGRPRDLRGAAAVSAAIRVSDEALEGIDAFLEKRRAKWDVSS